MPGDFLSYLRFKMLEDKPLQNAPFCSPSYAKSWQASKAICVGENLSFTNALHLFKDQGDSGQQIRLLAAIPTLPDEPSKFAVIR